jgi:hypothetical protein
VASQEQAAGTPVRQSCEHPLVSRMSGCSTPNMCPLPTRVEPFEGRRAPLLGRMWLLWPRPRPLAMGGNSPRLALRFHIGSRADYARESGPIRIVWISVVLVASREAISDQLDRAEQAAESRDERHVGDESG